MIPDRAVALAIAMRFLLYSGTLIVLGDSGADWTQHGNWRARETEPGQRRLLLAWLGVLTALCGLFVLQFVALDLTPSIADVAMLVRQTAWGRGWLLLAIGTLLGTGVAMLRGTLAMRAVVGCALAVAMGGLGHAAADDGAPLLARVLDAAHVVGAGLWIGTLACIARDAEALQWKRFSALATWSALVVCASGAGASLRRVQAASATQIVMSDYGRELGAKIALVLLLLVVGARHRTQVRAQSAPDRVSVRAELVIALIVLALTGWLTGTAPPGE